MEMTSCTSLEYVESCPENTRNWQEAIERKNCSNILQNCGEQEYHCLLNHFRTEAVELCAPKRYILNGFCAEYNEKGQRIQDNFDFVCRNSSPPCPSRYLSTEIYKYPHCLIKEIKEYTTEENSTPHNPVSTNGGSAGSSGDAEIHQVVLIVIAVLIMVVVLLLVILWIQRWRGHRWCSQIKERANFKTQDSFGNEEQLQSQATGNKEFQTEASAYQQMKEEINVPLLIIKETEGKEDSKTDILPSGGGYAEVTGRTKRTEDELPVMEIHQRMDEEEEETPKQQSIKALEEALINLSKKVSKSVQVERDDDEYRSLMSQIQDPNLNFMMETTSETTALIQDYTRKVKKKLVLKLYHMGQKIPTIFVFNLTKYM